MEIAGQDYADLASYQRRIEVLRRMTGEQRLALAFELWRTAREVTRAGIRIQFPEFTSEQIEHELAQRIMVANGAARVIASRS